MIENFEDKVANDQVKLEFAASGNITLLETRFNPNTGVKELMTVTETNSEHLEQLITDRQNRMEPIQRELKDLKALQKAVKARETEREDLAKEAAKKLEGEAV